MIWADTTLLDGVVVANLEEEIRQLSRTWLSRRCVTRRRARQVHMPSQSEHDTTSVVDNRDPRLIERVLGPVRRFLRIYHRAEVRGLQRMPDGGALVVSNHSGGMMTMDTAVFAAGFYERFGLRRPVYTLCHDLMAIWPIANVVSRIGAIQASRENAAAALRAGAVVMVFPGGEYDVYRPTGAGRTIDFNGRTGYIRTALATNVPIVPVVSIGGQETQLFLARGQGLAKWLGLKRFLRMDTLPVSIGVPFGLTVMLSPNIPLPSKIVTEVLDPIDVIAEFGSDPDIAAVDAHVRITMQRALDGLAADRRFPVLG
nr:1-acyl-sn-glycerol-3-phosphate acyltransferase [Mycobacterium sp. E2479]